MDAQKSETFRPLFYDAWRPLALKIDLNSLATLQWSIIAIEMYEGKNQDNKRLIVSSDRTRELELGKDLSLTKKTRLDVKTAVLAAIELLP